MLQNVGLTSLGFKHHVEGEGLHLVALRVVDLSENVIIKVSAKASRLKGLGSIQAASNSV